MKRRSAIRSTIRLFLGMMLAGVLCAGAICAFRYGYRGYQAQQQANRLEARQRALAPVGMQIPPVYQYDYAQTVCSIGGEEKSVATSGCGATCLSMVIRYLTGNADQSPQVLFETAYRNGDYYGYGLTHEALNRLADAYGVDYVWIDGDKSLLREALRNGYPVIAHMGVGQFADEGHYILLRGLTDDGKVVLNDPNSLENTWNTFTLEEIIAEGKTNTPFMVCRAAD